MVEPGRTGCDVDDSIWFCLNMHEHEVQKWQRYVALVTSETEGFSIHDTVSLFRQHSPY